MINVFIDTNIWLSLYHFTNDDLSQFEKLNNMLGNNINLIVPQQVKDEIIRNREAKIKEAFDCFDIKEPKYPAYCKGYDDYEKLHNDLSSIVKEFNLFRKQIKFDISNEKLPADKTIKKIFSMIEFKPCDKYIDRAYNRYRIGNPPGKDNKYGDAINWECLLDVAPEGEDLYFISADKDYRSLLCEKNEDKMNPFLAREWKDKKKSEIHFYSTLVSFFEKHAEEIRLKDESDKQNLIDDLYNSANFRETHGIISLLNRYSEWDEQEIEKICDALIENNQVLQIIGDTDVFEFYQTILANVNYDEQDVAIKKALEIINRLGIEIDYEAEKNDALEEYYNH